MQRIHKYASLLLLFLCAVPFWAASLSSSTADWMARVKDVTPLCRMTLPGTHNSGATSGGNFVQCQNSSIAAQLEAGVRVLDIRMRPSGSKLEICHSSSGMGTFFEADVMQPCVAFLKAHPSEAIVMSLKCDDGSEADYTQLLATHLAPYASYFVPGFDANMTLGAVRGRIVLLHRSEPPAGYAGGRVRSFSDNGTSFDGTLVASTGESANYTAEDYYSLSFGVFRGWDVDGKLTAVQQNMTACNDLSDAANRWFITFMSGTAIQSLAGPDQVANTIGPAMSSWLTNHSQGAYGLVLMDYAGSSKAAGPTLVRQLIDTNSRWTGSWDGTGLPTGVVATTISALQSGRAHWYRISSVINPDVYITQPAAALPAALQRAALDTFNEGQLWALVKVTSKTFRLYNARQLDKAALAHPAEMVDGATPLIQADSKDTWYITHDGCGNIRIGESTDTADFAFLNAYGGIGTTDVRYYQADAGSAWRLEEASLQGLPMLPTGVQASTSQELQNGDAHWYTVSSATLADKYITAQPDGQLLLLPLSSGNEAQYWCFVKDAGEEGYRLTNYVNSLSDLFLASGDVKEGQQPLWNAAGTSWYVTSLSDNACFISAQPSLTASASLNAFGGSTAAAVAYYAADNGSKWQLNAVKSPTAAIVEASHANLYQFDGTTLRTHAPFALYAADGQCIFSSAAATTLTRQLTPGVYLLRIGQRTHRLLVR